MELFKYNNQKVKVIDVDDQVFDGVCLFEDKDTFDEEFDALSVKVGYQWIKLFENEIKSVQVI